MYEGMEKAKAEKKGPINKILQMTNVHRLRKMMKMKEEEKRR